MSARDLAFALLVILLWGLNFVVIKIGLDSLPPMLLGATRFTLAAIPAIFFIRRPQVPLRWLVAYGLTISFGQFAFLFSAMDNGMPAGLASLVLQSQAFFTLLLAALLLSEKVRAHNLIGLLVAATGSTMTQSLLALSISNSTARLLAEARLLRLVSSRVSCCQYRARGRGAVKLRLST